MELYGCDYDPRRVTTPSLVSIELRDSSVARGESLPKWQVFFADLLERIYRG
jgi:hypothetical protein